MGDQNLGLSATFRDTCLPHTRPHPQSQGPLHLLRSQHSQTPTLSPVAQDLRVGRGLACKDDMLTLQHGLGLNGQSHSRRVCKVQDRRSGSFLSPSFSLSLCDMYIHTTLVRSEDSNLQNISQHYHPFYTVFSGGSGQE